MTSRSRFILHPSSFIPLFLIVFTVALHANAVGGWWLYDDPQLLLEAKRQSVVDLFFNRAEYVHLASHTFVPLQLLSYKFDLLFGTRPSVFYAHQVVALTTAVVLLFFFLRGYVDDRFAAVGAAFFAASWAATYAARTLMIRHYVEGLVLALVALLLWRRDRPIAASFCYLLAMLAKEVYAPLLLVFAVVSGRSRRLIAPSVALAVWFAWRWWMTDLVGGYEPAPAISRLFALFPTLWEHVVGPAVPTALRVAFALVVAALIAAFLLRERRRAALIILVIGVVAIAPVAPLAGTYFQWRYSFAFVACVAVLLTLAAGAVARTWSLVALSMLAVSATAMSSAQRHDYRAQTRVVKAEGRYVANERANAPALAATSPEWYLSGLASLRGAPAPRFFCSRFAIAAGAVDPMNVVTMDDRGHAKVLASTTAFGTPADWERERMRNAPDAPLSVTFSRARNEASWRFGPPGGEFTFITVPGYSAISLPPSGSQRVAASRERQWFRVRRAAPDGSWTMSPVLPVPTDGQTTQWKRP